MLDLLKEFFRGGDSAAPDPAKHAWLGFVRSGLLFILVFVGQYAIDASIHNKDLGALNTWADLLPVVIYIMIEFAWRIFRATNSPLTPVVKFSEEEYGQSLRDKGKTIPVVPENIDLNLPHPPES